MPGAINVHIHYGSAAGGQVLRIRDPSTSALEATDLLKRAASKFKLTNTKELRIVGHDDLMAIDTKERIAGLKNGDILYLYKPEASIFQQRCCELAAYLGKAAQAAQEKDAQINDMGRTNKELRAEVKKLHADVYTLDATVKDLRAKQRRAEEQREEMQRSQFRLMEQKMSLQSKGVDDVVARCLRTGEAVGSVVPYVGKLAVFLQEIQSLIQTRGSRHPVLIPVSAIRFTHHTVNAAMAFGEEHGNSQESIFKLFDQLFRGNLKPEEVEPLHVFAKVIPGEADVPGNGLGLFSRNNRRLVALLMFQAVRRDAIVKVQCYTYTEEDLKQNPRKRAWFDQGYDTPQADTGSPEPCTGLGLSIYARRGVSHHRGNPLFNPAETAILSLNRLMSRESSGNSGAHAGEKGKIEELLLSLKKRPREGGNNEDGEETLTFGSIAGEPVNKGKGGGKYFQDRPRNGGRGKGKGAGKPI